MKHTRFPEEDHLLSASGRQNYEGWSCGVSSSTLFNTSSLLTRSVQLIYILLLHHISQLPVVSSVFLLPCLSFSPYNLRRAIPIVTLKVNQSRYRPAVAPQGSTKLRFPDFVTTVQDGGKVVSLTHRPPLPHRKCSWYSFLLEAESTPGS